MVEHDQQALISVMYYNPVNIAPVVFLQSKNPLAMSQAQAQPYERLMEEW